MTEVSESEEIMLQQIANLSVTNDRQDKLLVGYREKITRLEKEVEGHEWNELQLQRSQSEINRLKKELGR